METKFHAGFVVLEKSMKTQALLPIAVILFSLGCNPLSGQVQPIPKGNQAAAFGISDAILADQLMLTVRGIGGTTLDNLKEQNLKPYMMPVRKCESSGMERTYLLASCLEYYNNLEKNYKSNLSPEFISLNLAQTRQSLSWEEIFVFLAKEGTINAAIIPYGATYLTSAVHATPHFRIANYLQLFREVTKPSQRVFEARKAIMRGNPVVIEFQADPSFAQALGLRSWLPQGQETQAYTLLAVGYDEAKQAFEVMSAWGSDWGKGGYLWISYDLFGRQATNGFVLIPDLSY